MPFFLPGTGANALVGDGGHPDHTIGRAQFFHKHANIIVPEIGFVGEF